MKPQKQPEKPTSELIAALPSLNRDRLGDLWRENFGKPPQWGLSRKLMLPILAFRIQERAHGGLKPELQARLREIVASLNPQSKHADEARNRFRAGTRIVREWQGKTYEVLISAHGYEFQGETYKSLSPIANRITGTRWSGPVFFGTKRKEAT